ncbi:MAG: DUF58 domain-containing protein [Phycisphaeraceae bacterium]|nr:MAG: DUF58 domain-containing protein [Phycisphaeraceae bacterium]
MDELLDSALIARLSRLDVTSRKVFSGKLKGERRSKKRGESVEFADHRPYVVGDDLRHIDWNIFGRLDRLFLKLFLEEEDLSLHIVIDASESADCGQPNKFFYAQQFAMALGYIGLINLNRVAITAIGGYIDTGKESPDEPRPSGSGPDSPPALDTIRDLRGRRRTQDLARFLCSLRPAGSTDFRDQAKRIALARRGKGVMVVVSDFFMKEGYEDGLRLLVGRGYDLFALQCLSPQEVEPDIGGDLKLVDVEDGDRAEVTISAPLLKRYKQNLAAYCGGLRDFCARREITALTVRTDTPVDVLLLDYLRRRGLVR